MKKINKLAAALLIWCLCLMCFSEISYGEEKREETKELNLHAQSAVLVDGDSGRVLYGQGEELARPMASTTKIMTCILALENGALEDVVTASKTAAAQPKVHLGVRTGETFYLRDLLYSLMLESHNDSAVMIAEHIGCSVEGFASMMNQKARDLGCTNTYFITPNGLDAKAASQGKDQIHSTTAEELASIMSYCIWKSPAREEFLKITQTGSYHFTDTEKKRSFDCMNHNALLTMMDGVVSGKTGFTGGAGYCYVGAMETEGRNFAIALLGCGWPPHKTYKWEDARKLFDYGMKNYAYQDVWKDVEFPEIEVENGIPESGNMEERAEVFLTLAEDEEKSLKILMAAEDKVEIKTSFPSKMKAPVKKGDPAGNITYLLNGEVVRKVPVYAGNSIGEKNWGWYWKNIYGMFLLVR